MKKHSVQNVEARPREGQVSELLILPDGRILVHNLTQPFAELLHELNPGAEQISPRLPRRNATKAGAARHPSPDHELPN